MLLCQHLLHDSHDIPIFVFRMNSPSTLLLETENVQSMENNIILEKIDKSFHSLLTYRELNVHWHKNPSLAKHKAQHGSLASRLTYLMFGSSFKQYDIVINTLYCVYV